MLRKTLLPMGFLLFSVTPIAFSKCVSPPPSQAKVTEVRPGLSTITGQIRDFDPCHPTVSLIIPSGSNNPPLMILVHGSGGVGDVKNIATSFERMGMAVLTFDAFAMNFLDEPNKIKDLSLSQRISLEARQRLLFAAAIGSYQWALSQPGIDTRSIYLYGVSNGAKTVINMASVVDPDRVKAIFAEGAPPVGLGLPKDVKVPVHLAYGSEDNFGGSSRTTKGLWNIQYPCRFNAPFGLEEQDRSYNRKSLVPAGYSAECSWSANPSATSLSIKQWFDLEVSKGSKLSFKIYKGAAHCMFCSDSIMVQDFTFPSSNIKIDTSIGGSPSAQKEFLTDIKSVVGLK